MSKRLLVMAGGTGGHVFPGLAVAHHLSAQGWTIHWLGTSDRMEAELVPAHGYPIAFIDIKGVRGNGVLRLLAAPWRILRSIWQARRVIKTFKPDVVLGMGGFASGPGGVAAWLAGIPLVLHEQNAAAGLTNRLLAHLASRVLLGFAGAFEPSENVEIAGNPVRSEVLALAGQPRRDAEPTQLRLLIIGGSLGARVLNQTVPAAAALLDGLQIRHQTGKGHRDDVEMRYRDAGVEAEVSEFITDMAAAYAWADVIVCRAGALTVAEVAAAGLPAIFVPLPHAVDDHQTRNAESLTRPGAAILLPQSGLTAQTLADALRSLQDPERRAQMSAAAAKNAILNATERVAAVCEAMTQQREKA